MQEQSKAPQSPAPFEYDLAVIGLGYVGLPLAIAFASRGRMVLGFDTDGDKVDAYNAARPYIKHIPAEQMQIILDNGGVATRDAHFLSLAKCLIVCVPTPLTRHRDPDMRYIESTSEMLGRVVRKGQLIVLESTIYPGATREAILPKLERGGLKVGRDFFLAYSPEREDPGRDGHSVQGIPKVVGGATPACLEKALDLYSAIVPRTVPVSSLETAEATKLMENIFRHVNIGLVNELKMVFFRMGVDIWEVVEAAKTKPFGFMPFYPGPGLGGHCIPVDPFYLTWKAREYDCVTRFIEVAGEINSCMPEYVVSRTAEELNREKKCLNGASILILGLAYKKDVDDIRESPSLRLLELFAKHGAAVAFHDPHVPSYSAGPRRPAARSVELDAAGVATYDAVVVSTDHSRVDYRMLADNARLIIDTRNVMAGIDGGTARIAKA